MKLTIVLESKASKPAFQTCILLNVVLDFLREVSFHWKKSQKGLKWFHRFCKHLWICFHLNGAYMWYNSQMDIEAVLKYSVYRLGLLMRGRNQSLHPLIHSPRRNVATRVKDSKESGILRNLVWNLANKANKGTSKRCRAWFLSCHITLLLLLQILAFMDPEETWFSLASYRKAIYLRLNLIHWS